MLYCTQSVCLSPGCLLQDAVSPWVLVYFLLLIIFDSFFLVNLALAVLYLQFTKEFSVSAANKATSRTLSMTLGKAVSRAVSTAVSAAASLAGDMLSPRALTPDTKVHTQGAARKGQQGLSANDAVVDQCLQTRQQAHGGQLDKQEQQELLVAKSLAAEDSESMLLDPQPVLWGSQQKPGPRHKAQCTDDSEELPGTLKSVSGMSDLPASPKRLPQLPGGGSWKRITGAASSFGSLPDSTSGSGQTGTSAEGAAEQDYVSAQVIVSRRTNSKKAAHWASADAAGVEPPAQKAQERWAELSPRKAELSPRTILKHPIKQPEQPVQPARQAAPLSPSSSFQCRDSCLEGCWQPFADGWEWLRQRCRDLVKVRADAAATTCLTSKVPCMRHCQDPAHFKVHAQHLLSGQTHESSLHARAVAQCNAACRVAGLRLSAWWSSSPTLQSWPHKATLETPSGR